MQRYCFFLNPNYFFLLITVCTETPPPTEVTAGKYACVPSALRSPLSALRSEPHSQFL